MKTKKFVALILTVVMIALVAIPAVAAPLINDSSNWENIDGETATALIKSSRGAKDKSFVYIYYSSGCSYSKQALPLIKEYADENNLKIYALNALDVDHWYGWDGFITEYPIEYPMVMAYNNKTDQFISKNRVTTKKKLHELLTSVGFKTTYQGKTYDVQEVIKADIPKDYKTPTFSDVPAGTELSKAIATLADRGITSGYPDGTFKPNNLISRAEAATFVARAMGLYLEENPKSGYVDIANDFWGTPYIMAASKKGILNGVGDNMFMPDYNITYAQALKMIVCMANGNDAAMVKGGWPVGYLSAAHELGIIDGSTYVKLVTGNNANKSATRGDVAQYIYKALKIYDPNSLIVNGQKLYIGMPIAKVGQPDDVLRSTLGWMWYVYGTKTYKNFIALGVDNGKVVAFTASGPSFEYMGYKMGDTITGSEEFTSNLFIDKNAYKTVHAVFVNFRNFTFNNNYGAKQMAGESKLIFYLTNGFRVGHGLSPYQWCQKAATVARLHSEDMANRNFYSHYSPEGKSPADRFSEYEVEHSAVGENICKGNIFATFAYDAWVNSKDHRDNLLSDKTTHLGVGGGYNKAVADKTYFTQNFYANN